MADAKLTALSAGAAITAATLIYGVQSAASVKISGSNLIAGSSLEFNGSGGLQVAAFTGDVTKAAGGTALTIPNDTVTYAKMQNVSAASKLLGRGSAGGAGDPEEITLGTGLTMTGTTLSSSGGSGTPGGSNTQIQFNDGGAFGGNADFAFDKTNLKVLIGGQVSFKFAWFQSTAALQPHVQVFNNTNSTLGLSQHTNDNNGVGIYISKSRGTAPGTNTALVNNDNIAYISFTGADGTALEEAAVIRVDVDGTPSNNNFTPGRFTFLTANATTPVERLRIDSTGRVTFRNATTDAFVVESDMSVLSGASAQYQGFGNVSIGAFEVYRHTRNASVSGHTIVNSGDNLLWQSFRGSDGAAFQEAALIQVQVDGAPAAGSMPGRFLFYTTPNGSTGGVERLRIDNQGHVVIGGSPNIHSGKLEVLSLDSSGNPVQFNALFSNDAAPPIWEFYKSRGTNFSTFTIVQSGDEIGRIRFMGADGSFADEAARISVFVDGTPGANDMPGRITFSTTFDGTTTPAERLRIDNVGRVTIGGFANQSGQALEVIGAVSAGSSATFLGVNASVNNNPNNKFIFSRGASVGSFGIVQNGDWLGAVEFKGDDGTAFVYGAAIWAEVDGTPGVGDMPTRLKFGTTPDGSAGYVERLRIDNAGTVVVCPIGSSSLATFDSGQTPSLQILGFDTRAGLGAARFNNGAFGARLHLAHSRGTTIGDYTIVVSGDMVGGIDFEGSDGTKLVQVAGIQGEVDGTPGANDMPGRLVFYTTPDGSNAFVERLRIDNVGTITFTNGASNTLVVAKADSTYNAISFTGAPGSFGTWAGFEAGDATDKNLYYNVLTGGLHSFGVAGTAYFEITATRVQVKTSNTNFVVGAGALTTTATDGFPYIPTCPGTPTGTPSTFTGRSPIVWDSTNLFLYAYSGGAWHTVDPTGGGGGGTPGGANTQVQFNDSGVFGGDADFIWDKTNNRLSIGGAAISNFLNAGASPQFQVLGTAVDTGFGVARFANGAFGARSYLAKSRGTTIGSMTVVNANDMIGALLFEGADGSNFCDAAAITVEVDGTPGNNDMPGRMLLQTTSDGFSTAVTRVMIDNQGRVTLNNGSTITGHVNETVAVFNHVAYGGL